MAGRQWTAFELVPIGKASPEYKQHLLVSGTKLWRNSRYWVLERQITKYGNYGTLIQLEVTPIDGQAVHDWRDLQRIKNEICGVEWAAMELYPPESKLNDFSNQYFLWCFEHLTLPFMFDQRLVSEQGLPNFKQRRWDYEARPDDLLFRSELEERLQQRIKGGSHCAECGIIREDHTDQDHEFQEIPGDERLDSSAT